MKRSNIKSRQYLIIHWVVTLSLIAAASVAMYKIGENNGYNTKNSQLENQIKEKDARISELSKIEQAAEDGATQALHNLIFGETSTDRIRMDALRDNLR